MRVETSRACWAIRKWDIDDEQHSAGTNPHLTRSIVKTLMASFVSSWHCAARRQLAVVAFAKILSQ